MRNKNLNGSSVKISSSIQSSGKDLQKLISSSKSSHSQNQSAIPRTREYEPSVMVETSVKKSVFRSKSIALEFCESEDPATGAYKASLRKQVVGEASQQRISGQNISFGELLAPSVNSSFQSTYADLAKVKLSGRKDNCDDDMLDARIRALEAENDFLRGLLERRHAGSCNFIQAWLRTMRERETALARQYMSN